MFLSLILLPIVLLMATPFILIVAPFRPGNIRSDYSNVVWSFYHYTGL